MKQLQMPNLRRFDGGRPQKVTVDLSDTENIECKCGSRLFDQCFRLRKLSKYNPRNPTGKDQILNFQSWVCIFCGEEMLSDAIEGIKK